jgi:hypothetical protein
MLSKAGNVDAAGLTKRTTAHDLPQQCHNDMTGTEIFFLVVTLNREKWRGQVTIFPSSVPIEREAFWWLHRSPIT